MDDSTFSETASCLSDSFRNLGKTMATGLPTGSPECSPTCSSTCSPLAPASSSSSNPPIQNHLGTGFGINGGTDFGTNGGEVISTQPTSLTPLVPNPGPNSVLNSLAKSSVQSLPAKTQDDNDIEDNDVEALSNNKVDVEIEPDVKANVVKINMCSFVCSLNCFSRPAKTD